MQVSEASKRILAELLLEGHREEGLAHLAP